MPSNEEKLRALGWTIIGEQFHNARTGETCMVSPPENIGKEYTWNDLMYFHKWKEMWEKPFDRPELVWGNEKT